MQLWNYRVRCGDSHKSYFAQDRLVFTPIYSGVFAIMLPFILRIGLLNKKSCGHHALHYSYPTLCSPMNCSPPESSVRGIPRKEYWSGLPFPTLGDLPHSGIKHESLASPALAGGFFTIGPPRKPHGHPTCE